MKIENMRMLLSLTAISMIVVLNIRGQTSKLEPPTMLRVQLRQSQSMPVRLGPPTPAPPKPLPIIPDPVAPDRVLIGTIQPGPPLQPAQPVRSTTYSPPMFTNIPPVLTNHPSVVSNQPPVFTNNPVNASAGILQQPKKQL